MRRTAIRQAAPFGEQAILPLTEQLLVDPDNNVRWTIVRTLETIGAAAETSLIAAANDPHPQVREAAASALGTIHGDSPQAIDALANALRDEDDRVRLAAINSLEKLGPKALPAASELVLRLGDRSFLVSRTVARMLPQLVHPDTYGDLLLATLEDAPPQTVIYAMAEVELPAEVAISYLAAKLSHTDTSVREQAARALLPFADQVHTIAPQLVTALQDPSPLVSDAAARSLASMGDEVIPLVVPLLPEEVRVIRLLGRIGSEATIPVLIEALHTEALAPAAARELASIGAAAVPLLGETLQNEQLRNLTMQTLASMGSQAAAAIPTITSTLPNAPKGYQMAAIDTLEAIGPAAVPALKELAQAGLIGTMAARSLLRLQEMDEKTELAHRSLEFFVSPDGHDAWSGTQPRPTAEDGPFRTLARAVQVLHPGDILTIRQGEYREALRPIRSGTEERPILIRNYPGEEVTLTGADRVHNWEPYTDAIYRAPMDWDLGHENQIFVNGVMLLEARWPNSNGSVLQPQQATMSAGEANSFTDHDLPAFDDPMFWQGAYVWSAGGLAWATWSVDISDFDPETKTFTLNRRQLDAAFPYRDEAYFPRAGNKYVIMGSKALLSEAEWWYDSEAGYLYLWPPQSQDPNQLHVTARARQNMLNLAGREHVHVQGLNLFASGLVTDDNTRHVLLDRLQAKYIGHSYRTGGSNIRLAGSHNEINSCEFAYSSGNILFVSGNDHRVINSYFHHGNYNATFTGLARITGERHLISHNTFRHAGRDILNIGWITANLIQYNVLSDAGWLTHDLGMTYGHTNDFGNTVIRYNWVHDNRSDGFNNGIYFDHATRNVIIHNNVVWNIGLDPIRINNPSYFVLVFNNTTYNAGVTRTFDAYNRNDLFGTIMANNIFGARPNLPRNVTMGRNLIASWGFTDPRAGDFTLEAGSRAVDAGSHIFGVTENYIGAPDLGAYPAGIEPWVPGHDFSQRPNPQFELAPIEFRNLVANSCFDDGTLNHWQVQGNALVVQGNNWGREPLVPTATGRHEVRLNDGQILQEIQGLEPNTDYRFSAWIRVHEGEISVSVQQKDTLEQTTSTDQGWVNAIVPFTTGDETTVQVRIAANGQGNAGNIGLQKVFSP